MREPCDGAVLGAADADAAPAPRIGRATILILSLGIGHVDDIVFVDEDRARSAELFPLGEEFAVLIENLDADIDSVGDENPPAGIECDAVRFIELARAGSLLSPCLNQFTIGVELYYSGIGGSAMSIGDKDVTVGCDCHSRRLIEETRRVTRHAGLAECHQHLPFGTEL